MAKRTDSNSYDSTRVKSRRAYKTGNIRAGFIAGRGPSLLGYVRAVSPYGVAAQDGQFGRNDQLLGLEPYSVTSRAW